MPSLHSQGCGLSGGVKSERLINAKGLLAFVFPFTFNSSLFGFQGSQKVHARYENSVVEIAASLQLSRNIILALLSLQSWKPFMQRWMRASILSLNSKAPTTILDNTSKAANAILKVHYPLTFYSV